VRRLLIISGKASQPFSPRGQRTKALIPSFSKRWDVELITRERAWEHRSGSSISTVRVVGRSLADATLLDKFEPWARRRLRGWRPDADAALLIGAPFSPLKYASSALIDAHVPYVVDFGDPWMIADRSGRARLIGGWRGKRAERTLWTHAAGGIVTTDGQAEAIRRMFPHLPLLVRPNGYQPTPLHTMVRDGKPGDELRLVYFGNLYSARVDLSPFLGSLAESGNWRRVVWTHYGHDFTGMLEGLRGSVTVEIREPIPWEEAVQSCARHDAAVVVGNNNPAQLPSKAIEYGTLGIPRVAVTKGLQDDALTRYAADKPGWLVVGTNQPDAAVAVKAHVEIEWDPASLRPLETDAWPEVAAGIVEWFERCIDRARAGR
jgi:hypothetical protein